MIRKLRNIINKWAAGLTILIILVIWQIISSLGWLPAFMLPSPIDVILAFCGDFSLLLRHAGTTLTEAFVGLLSGVFLGFFMALVMDSFDTAYRAFYPLVVISQTIPTVAIAPLLVLWLGYGILPKVTLIIITSFFPITIGLLEGFRSADPDAIRLLKAMGASRWQRFIHIKLPSSLGYFFSALRISVAYSIIGAVIAEWLGGNSGLGVYMTRVRKSYAFDKMFAVIFFISALSLILMVIIKRMQWWIMPWEHVKDSRKI